MINFPPKWLRLFNYAIFAVVIVVCVSHLQAQQASYNSEFTPFTEQSLKNIPLGLEVFLPVPASNPLTPEKAELGRQLFFDKQLSRDRSISCADCHLPEKAFTDGLTVSVGINESVGRRNAQTLLNVAYQQSMFRDGRSKTLEQQALDPMINPLELGNSFEEIVRRLNADESYPSFFERAFGSRGVTIERTAEAIASFERTLLSGNSVYDRYLVSRDPNTLSTSAQRGFQLFIGKANCQLCHEHSLLSDGRFHNTGVSWGAQPLDLGRFEVTGFEADRGKFRTPSLRDIELTAPYMHDGSMESLEEVVDFYNGGGNTNPYLDPAIRPLNLSTQEQADLVAFLNSLTGSDKP